jgi:hypothetical protein
MIRDLLREKNLIYDERCCKYVICLHVHILALQFDTVRIIKANLSNFYYKTPGIFKLDKKT